MRFKYLFSIFLACFAILEVIFVVGAISFFTLIDRRQQEANTAQDFERIFHANETELVGNMMLGHQALLREQLRALIRREGIRVELKSHVGEFYEGQSGSGVNISKIFPITYGGVHYGEIKFLRKQREIFEESFGIIIVFIFFQVLLFTVVTYFIYVWSLKFVITPLEDLVKKVRDGKSETLKIDSQWLPAEVILMGNILTKLWTELKEQSHQAALGKVSTQVAHDIRSPLAALNSVLGDINQLPEDSRLLIRTAINRIKDIANELLIRNAKPKEFGCYDVVTSEIISALIEPLVVEKRVQYRDRTQVSIEFEESSTSYGLCASIQTMKMKRVISNLIDNAVDAVESAGIVRISLQDKGKEVLISVHDNGKGIRPEIIPKLMKAGETYDKANGTGLGLYHAKTVIEELGGSIQLYSKLGVGTEVRILFAKALPPSWFVPELILSEKSSVIVLDDDFSIHQLWDRRLKSFRKDLEGLRILHFVNESDFIRGLEANQEILENGIFLIDYELLGSLRNGVNLIEQFSIQNRSILVTNRFDEPLVREKLQRNSFKMIPKILVSILPIRVVSSECSSNAIG